MPDKIKTIATEQQWNIFVNMILTKDDATRDRLLGKFDVNVTYEKNGSTFLIEACRRENYDAVKYLVDHGADLNKAADDKKNPLHIVATIFPELTDIFEYLLKNNADTEARDMESMTPLLLTSGSNLLFRNFMLLLKYGADVNCHGFGGMTPLYRAAHEGLLKNVRILHEQYNVDLNGLTERGETALQCACEQRQCDVVKYLVEKGASVNLQDDQGHTAVCRTIVGSRLSNKEEEEILQFLINHDAEINTLDVSGDAPIMLACELGKVNLVRILLANNVDLSRRVAGSENNNRSQYSIMCAPYSVGVAEADRLSIFKLLLKKNPELVNDRTAKGLTALHMATANQYYKDLDLLLACENIDVNAQGAEGQTALDNAIIYEDSKMVAKLLRHGANPNTYPVAEKYAPPLVLAAQKGNLQLVKMLVEKNISGEKTDLNIQMLDGTTALFMAAQEGHYKVVKCLLEMGANPEIYRNDETSPKFIIYRESVQPEVVNGPRLLRENYKKTFQAFVDHQFGVDGAQGRRVKYSIADAVEIGEYTFVMLDYEFIHKMVDDLAKIDIESIMSATSRPAQNSFANIAQELNGATAQKAQSSYSYLRQAGYSHQDIIKMREETIKRREDDETCSLPVEKPKDKPEPSWLNGLIATTDVTPITLGSPNCYFYFPPEVLENAGLENSLISRFKHACTKFCALQGEQGVKTLGLSKPVTRPLEINGELYASSVEIKYELKLSGTAARFFCYKLNADAPNEDCSLIVPAVFAKDGAHDGKSVYSIIPKTIKLNTFCSENKAQVALNLK